MTGARLFTAVFAILFPALPAVAQSWEPYQFRGTEHFKYELEVTEDGENKTGWFTLDLADKGEEQVQMRVKAVYGENSSEFTTTGSRDDAYTQIMMQTMMNPAAGPISMTLFAPWWGIYFTGRDWSLGSGWSFSSGDVAVSFKIESTCGQAGVEGKTVVWRENDVIRAQSCIAEEVALPLAVMFRNENGDVYNVTLSEYRP